MPFSLSNRWNVARLTSAISSSPRTKRCPPPGKLLLDCGISAAGSVDAKALPISENPSPAAPSVAAAAALVVPFPFAACFIRAIVISFATFWIQVDVTGVPVPLTNAESVRAVPIARTFFFDAASDEVFTTA